MLTLVIIGCGVHPLLLLERGVCNGKCNETSFEWGAIYYVAKRVVKLDFARATRRRVNAVCLVAGNMLDRQCKASGVDYRI